MQLLLWNRASVIYLEIFRTACRKNRGARELLLTTWHADYVAPQFSRNAVKNCEKSKNRLKSLCAPLRVAEWFEKIPQLFRAENVGVHLCKKISAHRYIVLTAVIKVRIGSRKRLGTNNFVRTKSHRGSKFSKISLAFCAFHKQRTWGVVGTLINISLRVYYWVRWWKNFENRSLFGKVTDKSTVSSFFWLTGANSQGLTRSLRVLSPGLRFPGLLLQSPGCRANRSRNPQFDENLA